MHVIAFMTGMADGIIDAFFLTKSKFMFIFFTFRICTVVTSFSDLVTFSRSQKVEEKM